MPDECAVLVAQHFLPLNVVASQRALRMARALLNRYARVYVVCGGARDLDPSFLDHVYGKDVLEDPRLIRINANPILKHYGYGVRSSPIERVAGGVATRLLCGPGLDWILPLRRSLQRIPGTERVGVVLATGPPFIPFRTVVRWARGRRAPVILDYRDLWTGNPHAQYPAAARAVVSRWLERPVNRAATLLTTVSEGCREVMLDGNRSEVTIRVLYNSPDRAYLQHYRAIVDECQSERLESRSGTVSDSHQAGGLRIVFTGQVYSGCTFAPLLSVMTRLSRERVRQIAIHYYGDSSALIRQEFQQFNLADCLTDHGRVSKDDSLRAMLGADVLLSLIHTDRMSASPAVTGLMTTKLFDYLLSGRPILNIGPANAEAADFAARVGCREFHSFTADDRDGVRGFLEAPTAESLSTHAGPLSVSLPDFEAQLNAILDEATAVPSTRAR